MTSAWESWDCSWPRIDPESQFLQDESLSSPVHDGTLQNINLHHSLISTHWFCMFYHINYQLCLHLLPTFFFQNTSSGYWFLVAHWDFRCQSKLNEISHCFRHYLTFFNCNNLFIYRATWVESGSHYHCVESKLIFWVVVFFSYLSCQTGRCFILVLHVSAHKTLETESREGLKSKLDLAARPEAEPAAGLKLSPRNRMIQVTDRSACLFPSPSVSHETYKEFFLLVLLCYSSQVKTVLPALL